MSSSSSSSSSSSTTNPASGRRTGDDIKQAKRLISQAISLGAPAYNAGDIAECARVYKETAKHIIPMLPAALGANMEKTLDQQHRSDDAAAWAFRGQFDAILDYQTPMVPASEADVAKVNNFEPFTAQQLPEQPPLEVMDNVMGGVSRGHWNEKNKTFSGCTSLEFNGGFASLRWRFPNVQNWSFAKGLYLKVKHSKPQEHTFRIILKDLTCERIRLANYKAIFSNPNSNSGTGDDVEQPILLPFGIFNQMEQMGNAMVGAPPFNPSSVTEIGIMAIKPTVVGDFNLTVEEWGLYS